MNPLNWHIWIILRDYWPELLRGALVTLELAVAVTALAMVLGLALALARMSGIRALTALGKLYVEVIRGVPPLLLLFVVYFTLPNQGITLPAFASATIALGGYSAAFTCEIFRGGILAVPPGQLEAGRSLGLNAWQLYRKVILPQAFRAIIPPMTNQLILNLKGTSLAVTITVPELMHVASTGASTTFRAGEFYLLAGLFYLSFALPLSKLTRRLEIGSGRRTTRRRRSVLPDAATVGG